MPTISDDFGGVALDANWTVGPYDTPIVGGGVLTDPTGGIGLLQITRTESLTGTDVYAEILIDTATDTPPTVLGLGYNVSTQWYPQISTLFVNGGPSASDSVAAATVVGRVVLRISVSAGVATALVYPEGGDPLTPTYTVSVGLDGTGVSDMAGGVLPTLVAFASDDASWDDFYATSGGDPTPPPAFGLTGAGLTFSITSLRYPEVEPVRLHRLTQYDGGEVGIPLNGMRDAKVTISIYDPACADVLPLERFLFVRYLGTPVFWGPITDPEWDLAGGRVTINALGPDFRASKHFIRIGDVIDGETVSEDEDVPTPVTSDGMWDVLTAAFNTDGQTDRGVPDLGIARGVIGDSGSTSHITSRRGDQVIDKIQRIADSALGPDYDFRPRELDAGSYAFMDTYERMGTDKPLVKLQYGWGLDNLDAYAEATSGSSVVTHRHTLSEDGHNRGTAAAAGPSVRFGPYVEWDTISGNPKGADNDAKNAVLAEIGRGTVIAYGEAPPFLDVTLKPTVEGNLGLKYGADYDIGDTVYVSAHKGFYRRTHAARITKVTLSQTNSQRTTLESLELVPQILTGDDVGGDGDDS